MQEIEAELSRPGAWDNPDALRPVLKEKSRMEDRAARLGSLRKAKQDVEEWLDLAQEEPSEEVLQTLKTQIDQLGDAIETMELSELLSRPEDKSAAIMEIHPGAGGTESQDWAEMLLRMYRRWADRKGYEVAILDFLEGDEAGVKSVTLQFTGPHAYGFLKSESGIHRLIRISPFDASGRRHTSFASVDVYPDADDDIEIDLNEADVRVDTYRASGAGGQHVNKTSSAVRLTHIPSGIVVACQNEKSQIRNREIAWKLLRARMYEMEMKKRQAERQAQYETKDAIGFGSQIRTYTLQPYRLVKDHRTGTEIGNVEAVLDGELDELIRNYLLQQYG